MYKNNKLIILIPVIIAVSLVAGIYLSLLILNTPGDRYPRKMAPGTGKINTLLSLIENRYVDTISMDSLVERLLPLILDELDPHSGYIPASSMSATNESLDGEFDGIGVMFNMMTDTVIVLNAIPKGPSAEAGILSGDRIITINDSLVAGVKMGTEAVMKRLRGPRGTKVNLGIERMGVEELVAITVTRGVIPVRCITAAYMIRPGVGFISFLQFSRYAHAELMAAVQHLKAQGMKRLILDLRENPGGFLDQAIIISNEFLAQDKMIVYTQERSGKKTFQYSNGKGSLQDVEPIILIDSYSASSSEILAGALQDNDKGTIIGRRSFGKGLVQEQIPFADSSAVRLTIARYYTPTGRSIQKPYAEGTEQYRKELITRFEHNELFSADSIHFADSLKFTTPGGKIVYGGGGIMPDIFVPIDTTTTTAYFREVVRRNILYKFTIEYADQHREALAQITSLSQFDAFFKRDSGMLQRFIQYAAGAGVSASPREIERSGRYLTAWIQAYVGRYTALEDNAYYHALEPVDNVVMKALEQAQLPQ